MTTIRQLIEVGFSLDDELVVKDPQSDDHAFPLETVYDLTVTIADGPNVVERQAILLEAREDRDVAIIHD